MSQQPQQSTFEYLKENASHLAGQAQEAVNNWTHKGHEKAEPAPQSAPEGKVRTRTSTDQSLYEQGHEWMKNTGEYLHNHASSLFGSHEGGAAAGGAAAGGAATGGAAAGGAAAGSEGNAGGSFTDSLRHASEQARSIAADKLQHASDYLKNKDG